MWPNKMAKQPSGKKKMEGHIRKEKYPNKCHSPKKPDLPKHPKFFTTGMGQRAYFRGSLNPRKTPKRKSPGGPHRIKTPVGDK